MRKKKNKCPQKKYKYNPLVQGPTKTGYPSAEKRSLEYSPNLYILDQSSPKQACHVRAASKWNAAPGELPN